MVENKKNVSFDNIKMLASLSNDGVFARLFSTIRSEKQKLDNLTKEARVQEKKLLLEDAEKLASSQANVVTEQQSSAKSETVVSPKHSGVSEISRRTESNSRNIQRNNSLQNKSQFARSTQSRTTLGNQYRTGQRPMLQRPQSTKKPDFLRTPLPKFVKPTPPPAPVQKTFGGKKKIEKHTDDKKVMNKRTLLRRGLIEEKNIEERLLTRKLRTKKQEAPVVVAKPQGPAVITTENLTVKILSESTGKSVSEIIKQFMILGMMVTINSPIDFASAELVSNELGVELVQKLDKTSEDKLKDIQENIKSYSDEEAIVRPPVVTVMGHVDHGKTSLLDYIRNTKVSLGEAGGITQHIGAYQVQTSGKTITFIDTPGHEAFTQMRARGAMATDIAVLVVAADDGIMPQTVEAINHIKAANVPLIVAINKMDKVGADPDRIMQQLTEHNVVPEAWGGDAIIVKISAKTGEGIDKLLEMILLVSEMCQLKANPKTDAIGVVLEARLDKGKGPMASLLIKDGTLNIGDTIVCGLTTCKVKAMIDDNGKNVKSATPSMAVSVVGFNEVPSAGDTFTEVDEKLSKEIISDRKSKIRSEMNKMSVSSSLEDMMAKMNDSDKKILNILLKTDVNGSLEAIKSSVLKLNNDYAKINIIHSAVGAVTESDIVLAQASNAIVLAFNTKTDSKAKTLAERNKIEIKNYKIIYALLEDMERIVKGLKEPVYEEEILGHAEVLMVFKLTGVGLVAGSLVKDGKVRRNEHARVFRDNVVIADTMISSVKIVKDDVKEAAKGYECGIKLNYDEFKVGDIIECYTLNRVED